ncbi:MAG TPA: maleylpyruvate isomerase family mycothiol-dependent enzyme [Acidimicrobiales bacterium]|jgi:maleylpyruvate isomerase|nr:maleylpyruvate isomerase family mycothiol-dependent enzyme [Acidimicrobiales bacterium]
MRPAELSHLAGAEARLLARIEGLTDGEAAAPSKLPDWSRAEVLTHLARNADAFRRLAEGAMRGEAAEMYPGGLDGRAADIALGRGKPAAEVVSDVAQSVEWLHETWAAMPAEAWSREGLTARRARPITMAEAVVRRWLEVEVHHLDLNLGAAAEDWPTAFAESTLPRAVERLPAWAREPADGRWVLWADDLALAWTVSSLAGAVTLSRFEEDGPAPDVIFRGPAAQVLLLLYRGERGGLTVSGDEGLAAGFNSWFPCP